MQKALTYSLILAAFFGLASLQPEVPLSPQNGGKSININTLQEGDILFSTTNGIISDVIRKGTSGPISHVAIVTDVLKKDNDALVFIVESVKPKVHKVAFNEYASDATVVVAFRHPTATQAQRANLVAWLNQQAQAGTPYNLWAALFAAPKFHYLQKIRLVNFGATKGTFCSKLAIDAYKQINIDLAKLTPGQNWDPNSLTTLQWFDDLNYIGHLKFKQ